MKLLGFLVFTLLSCATLQGTNIIWSSPQTTISSASVNASDHQLAIDANGNLVAVWVESNLVKASTKQSGNWSSPVTLSASGGSSPRVVSDSNGNATAIWVESNGVVKASTHPLNGSWSAASTLSGTNGSAPVICVDSAGDVVAAWVRAGNIESSTKLFGGSWSTKVTITSSSAAIPSIAMGGTSSVRVVVVWRGVSSGTNVVYAANKLISGSWSAAQAISDTTINATQPRVAVDKNGNAQAAWYSYETIGVDYGNVIVNTAAFSNATVKWGSISELSSPGIYNPSLLNVCLAFDGIGNLITLWNTSFDGATFHIQSAVKPVNGPWTEPVDLITPNIYSYTAKMSATNYGDVLALYSFFNGSSLLIQSIESDISGYLNNTWSVPINISQGADNAYPKVAAVLSGNTVKAGAIWLNYDGSNTKLVGVTGSKTLVLPPTSPTVTQSSHNLGVFTEYYNTLSWTASTDPHVVGYVIFRNGVFIEQVGSNVTSYIDANRTQNGSVTYYVSAIDANNSQSAGASVSYP